MKKKTVSAKPSRRSSVVSEDDILAEYDFRSARRNPYAERFRSGATLVALDPDVAKSFPDSAAVNDALRALAKVKRKKSSA
jgi:hypothetical protein